MISNQPGKMRKHGALILVALVVGLAAMPPALCQDGGGKSNVLHRLAQI